MTIEEIIEMARQIFDIDVDRRGRETYVCDEYGLAAFAKLVAEKEREAVIDLVDGYAKDNTDLADAIRARGQK